MDHAQSDMNHAKGDVERGFYDWSCYPCRQATEKAINTVFQKMD